ncbi:hypothetical protein SAMN05421823_105311 [Catalinimonas alkaloidigena]|uniref:Uncharacterized protein n=1 Tax=Catalinimonas alkaloidigena TaxID=1075417 RepID=A0A1G9JH95_9BACT|nr:hypothetical protein [Catalinimonas alkaloidigena]SDL36682.1 hypothetical protein SAMN05421823_105311 [Catalinimonas alkaloidigena]
MKTDPIHLITRRLPLEFSGDEANTKIDIDAIRREFEEKKYTLLSERPVSVSVGDKWLYVTFLLQEKQERTSIGFQ